MATRRHDLRALLNLTRKARAMTDEQEQKLRNALSLLPRGEWEVWTSNSFRRVSTKRGADGGVLHGTVQRDGHPDLSMNEKELRALCALRNTIAEVLGEV